METPSGRFAPRLPGDLEVVRLLGKGGMGSVFEVVSRRTGARYAAKTLLRSADESARARFRREAELLARCDRHPGIVKVHTSGEGPDGTPYLVLDLVRGESLADLLEREGKLEPRRAATLVRDIALALEFVHALGVVHRDVKPSNVLLDQDAGGAPRLTDFGLATAEDVERLTKTGAFLGTVHYCAPEQVSHAPVDARTDLFSLGAVLFRAVAGVTPFEGEDAVSTISRLVSELAAPDARSFAPEVPVALARVIAQALEKDPERRYASARALADDLDRFLAGKPVLARNVLAPKLVRAALAALAVTVVVLVGALLLRHERRRAAALALLADGEAALGRAQKALGRAREATGTAPVSSAAFLAYEEAARESSLALERCRAARAAGLDASGDGAVPGIAASEAALAEAAVGAARIERAIGRAGKALARIEGVGLATADVRLARAQTLAALGRKDEARAVATAWLAEPGDKLPELVETAADVLAAAGDPARARTLYTGLLKNAGRRGAEIQGKRGAAAWLAGDETAANADLRAAIPDPLALSETRAANARFAGLAPVLWHRALAASGEAARERDLEGAWRLADPPPELAERVAEAWVHFELWDQLSSQLFSTGNPGPELLKQYRHESELTRRAVSISPLTGFERRWATSDLIRVWAEQHQDPAVLVRLADELLEIWPENPGIRFLATVGRYRQRASSEQVLAYAYASLDGIVALPRHDVLGIQAIARRLGEIILDVNGREKYPAETTDFPRLVAISEIGDSPTIWGSLAMAAMAHHDLALVRLCADRMLTAKYEGHGGDYELMATTLRCQCLEAEGRGAEGIELLLAYDRKRSSEDSLVQLLVHLRAAQRWEDMIEATQGREPSPRVLDLLAQAYEKLGRDAEAAGTRARLEKARAASERR